MAVTMKQHMNSKPPLILLSGMGADSRVFDKQIEAIPNLIVPKWIDPVGHESLSSYAARLAEVIDPREPCFIGGASFGGFVALEMIPHLDVIACFLIGSVRSPDELPESFHLLKKASRAANAIPFEVLSLLSKVCLLSSGTVSGTQLTELMKQVSDADASFMRWACRAVLEWNGTNSTGDVPIYHIHGEKDFVLPVKNTSPDVVVTGAGHALSISHHVQVSQFLKDKMIESTANVEYRRNDHVQSALHWHGR